MSVLTGEVLGMSQNQDILPTVMQVADIGPGNKGVLDASDVVGEERKQLAADAELKTRPTTGDWECIDSRPKKGIKLDECNDCPEVNAQCPGGEAVAGPVIDYLLEKNPTEHLKAKVVRHVRHALSRGRKVIMHGDEHNDEEGCGFLKKKRPVLISNAENADVIIPIVDQLMVRLGVNAISVSDISEAIATGYENALNDELWDINAKEHVATAVAEGAEYQILEGDHNEKLEVIELAANVGFDKVAFMRDHTLPDGTHIGAFGFTLGQYKAQMDKEVDDGLITQEQADKRVMCMALLGIGITKEMSAEEQGHGEALPVAVLA